MIECYLFNNTNGTFTNSLIKTKHIGFSAHVKQLTRLHWGDVSTKIYLRSQIRPDNEHLNLVFRWAQRTYLESEVLNEEGQYTDLRWGNIHMWKRTDYFNRHSIRNKNLACNRKPRDVVHTKSAHATVEIYLKCVEIANQLVKDNNDFYGFA